MVQLTAVAGAVEPLQPSEIRWLKSELRGERLGDEMLAAAALLARGQASGSSRLACRMVEGLSEGSATKVSKLAARVAPLLPAERPPRLLLQPCEHPTQL